MARCLDPVGRAIVDELFDKWSLAVLAVLCDRPARFAELRARLDPITSKSLTQTLRRLERNGVVERTVLAARPVAVEYSITPLGRSLEAPLHGLLDWLDNRRRALLSAQERFDRDVARVEAVRA